ncbi:glycoside hydrolase family 30 protein [Kiritimatiellota bacterium B12222]|nr:glycoside hydrolase family 30 protein [Kiritimatiellota bacterium B12222]
MKQTHNHTQYVTARDNGERLAPRPLAEIPRPLPGARELTSVLVSSDQRFQSIEGFGGAFTESAAVTLNKMSASNRELILKAYFDPEEGHGYTLCRTHMNSCDFSTGNYACCDTPGDTALSTFNLDREQEALLPMIKDAYALAKQPIKLFISPWSPPAWMKDTGMMNLGGKLKAEYQQTWADYYVRFIRELEAEGIPVWGLTVQNEPAAKQTWDSCIYTAEEEKDFVRDYLGPTLEREGLSHIKVIIWDHNRDMLVHRAHVAYSDPEASKYIWGAGFHWYAQEKFEHLNLVHDAWPDKQLLFTEGCQEGGPHLGSWETGERYARSMIRDLNRWTAGWVDWNLILDEKGGPNHVGNFCSAPIIADTINDKVLFQSSYYSIGHFARFIKPGAQRILCANTRDDLESAAFVNPDGQVVMVALNVTETEWDIEIVLNGERKTAQLPRRSISTFVFDGI